MKLQNLGVALAAILGFSAIALAIGIYFGLGEQPQIIGNNNEENNKATFDDGMNMFTEQSCVDEFGTVKCTEKTYVQCKEDGLKVPVMTGYTIKEKVAMPQYIEQEKIVIQERKLSGEEMPSPQDRIEDSDVYTYGEGVRIEIKNAKWRKYIDSNSMDPLIDIGTTTIEIKPKNANEIKVGDIIAYKMEGYDYALVHRVIEIGNDEKGIYFITKGDNFWKEDPKVRFSQIDGIVVGILY